MPDLARDAQRLAEVLLGEIPLPEAEADQSEILVVPAHARVQPRALVELQRLLEVAGRLAPFAQILVDTMPRLLSALDQAVGIVDATERGGGVLQPLDRLGRPPQPAGAHTERDAELSDRSVVGGIAQDRVCVSRVVPAGAVAAGLHACGGQAGGDASGDRGVAQQARGLARAAQRRERGLVRSALHLGVGQPFEQAGARGGLVFAGLIQRRFECLDGAGEVVRREMQVSDRFMLSRRIRKRVLGMSQIRGDRSLHSSNPRSIEHRMVPRRFAPGHRVHFSERVTASSIDPPQHQDVVPPRSE